MTNMGVTSYGVYVPRYRLSRKTISAAIGKRLLAKIAVKNPRLGLTQSGGD